MGLDLYELQRRAGVKAIFGTSADESLLLQRAVDAAVQKALDEQRERIAAAVSGMGCTNAHRVV